MNAELVWPYCPDMDTNSDKSSCSPDVNTVREPQGLTKRRRPSRAAALRRAVQSAAKRTHSDGDEALRAFDRLQAMLALDQETAGLWAEQVRQERRAARRNTSWTQERPTVK